MREPDAVTSTPLDPGDPHGRGVPQRPDAGTERRLWFGLLAAPLAWMVAEVVGFAVVGRTCTAGGSGPGMRSSLAPGLDTWHWVVLLGVPLAAAALSAAGLVTAVGVFRRWTGAVRMREAEGWNRVEFMAIAGAIVSAMLLLNIAYFAIMPLIVDPCMRAT